MDQTAVIMIPVLVVVVIVALSLLGGPVASDQRGDHGRQPGAESA
jgi:hypothetical protein